MLSTKQLNWFPANYGVSNYLIPHVIMSGHNLDFNKLCQLPFGAYVQVTMDNNPTNKNALRTPDVIYFQPLDNKHGRH